MESRATISGSDGVYSFADLPAGAWTVTAQVDGYADASAALQVVPAKATRSDIVMNASATGLGAALASNAAATPAAVAAPRSRRAGPCRTEGGRGEQHSE